jgi:hypothetical protein
MESWQYTPDCLWSRGLSRTLDMEYWIGWTACQSVSFTGRLTDLMLLASGWQEVCYRRDTRTILPMCKYSVLFYAASFPPIIPFVSHRFILSMGLHRNASIRNAGSKFLWLLGKVGHSSRTFLSLWIEVSLFDVYFCLNWMDYEYLVT